MLGIMVAVQVVGFAVPVHDADDAAGLWWLSKLMRWLSKLMVSFVLNVLPIIYGPIFWRRVPLYFDFSATNV